MTASTSDALDESESDLPGEPDSSTRPAPVGEPAVLTESTAPREAAPLTYAELFRFFIPLGITPIMFTSTHTAVVAALARLSAPEANLAVYSVVQAVVNTVKAPALVALQTHVTLVEDRKSFKALLPYTWGICAFFVLAVAALGFTPAGEWVLRRVIGIQEPFEIALSYSGLRIAALLPIVEVFRNSMQGLAVGLKATGSLPAGTALRVVFTALFLLWVVSARQLEGVVVGMVAWTAGIAIEGFVVTAYLIYRFGSPLRAAAHMPRRGGQELTPSRFFKFFTPLAVMMTVAACTPPVIQGGLARGASPTETLAAFGVAWSLRTILTGPLYMLHQCPIVFVSGANDPRLRKVHRFCLGVGGMMSGIMLIFSTTPFGSWIVGSVLGVPDALVPLTMQTTAAMALLPLIGSWREAYWGVLMGEQRTNMIGGGKVANLVTVVAGVLVAFGALGRALPFHPAIAGALIVSLGEAVEAYTVWRHATRVPRAAAKTVALDH